MWFTVEYVEVYMKIKFVNIYWGHAVAQLVEAMRYKTEGRGFDSRWCHFFHWHNPSGRTMALGLTQPLTEMSTRNGSLGKGDRCVVLTTLSPSCADCLEIWETQPPGTHRPRFVMGLLYLKYLLIELVLEFLLRILCTNPQNKLNDN